MLVGMQGHQTFLSIVTKMVYSFLELSEAMNTKSFNSLKKKKPLCFLVFICPEPYPKKIIMICLKI